VHNADTIRTELKRWLLQEGVNREIPSVKACIEFLEHVGEAVLQKGLELLGKHPKAAIYQLDVFKCSEHMQVYDSYQRHQSVALAGATEAVQGTGVAMPHAAPQANAAQSQSAAAASPDRHDQVESLRSILTQLQAIGVTLDKHVGYLQGKQGIVNHLLSMQQSITRLLPGNPPADMQFRVSQQMEQTAVSIPAVRSQQGGYDINGQPTMQQMRLPDRYGEHQAPAEEHDYYVTDCLQFFLKNALSV
jgi:hypothetical protein